MSELVSELGIMVITVRNAISSDIDWIMVQLKEFAIFFDGKKNLYGDEEVNRNNLDAMIKTQIFLIAVTGDSERAGFIGGHFFDHPFNSKLKLLSQTFYWVSEKFRGSRAALLLLNKFTELGEKVADWVLFTVQYKSPLNERCLTKRGYKLQERTFLKEIG